MTSKKSIVSTVAMVHAIHASSGLTVPEILKTLKAEKDAQVFDAGSIAGPYCVKLAFFHADTAFKENKNLVRDKMLEVLLRAAGSRQVADAVKRVGVKDPKSIIIGFKGDMKRKARILEKLDARETKWKPIRTGEEKKAIERMVLLQIE